MRDVATSPTPLADRGASHATPRELLLDVLAWDVVTWSSSLTYWQRYTTVDLTRSTALEIGAGESGGLSLWLALQGCDVLCTTPGNVCDKVRAMHRRYGVGHRIRYASMDALELREQQTFDVIAFKSVLGGIGTDGRVDRQQQAMTRLHAALRGGGNLLFAENLAATRAHAALRSRIGAGKDRWLYPTLREMESLLAPFSTVHYATAGFVGAWGASDRQRRVSGAVDAFFCRWLVPASWQYVIHGVAVK
jgi:methyltransferase family protein